MYRCVTARRRRIRFRLLRLAAERSLAFAGLGSPRWRERLAACGFQASALSLGDGRRMVVCVWLWDLLLKR